MSVSLLRHGPFQHIHRPLVRHPNRMRAMARNIDILACPSRYLAVRSDMHMPWRMRFDVRQAIIAADSIQFCLQRITFFLIINAVKNVLAGYMS